MLPAEGVVDREPTPGPATDAMRLRPATRRERAGGLDELVARLGAVLELHSPGVLVPLCRECLLPHPCPTYVAATGGPTTTDIPEEESQ